MSDDICLHCGSADTPAHQARQARTMPVGCVCPPCTWYSPHAITPVCDRYQGDGNGNCEDCEHIKSCHAKGDRANEELARLAGQVENKDAALLACAKAIWPNYTLFNGTLEDSVPALIQELVKENAELREEVRLDHLAFLVVEDKLTAAQQQADQYRQATHEADMRTQAAMRSEKSIQRECDLAIDILEAQAAQAEAKGFERGVRAAMKLCSQSGEMYLLDAIHCLLPKAGTTPDATPTPRTDALGVHLQGTDIHYWWHSYERLARSLETELESQRAAQEPVTIKRLTHMLEGRCRILADNTWRSYVCEHYLSTDIKSPPDDELAKQR